jgi:hypothetical protein
MASSDRLTRLRNIRDNAQRELEDETLRRATLAAAGDPPPTNYSSGGKSVSWNDYMRTQLQFIRDIDEMVLVAGGDDGGIPEVHVRTWS